MYVSQDCSINDSNLNQTQIPPHEILFQVVEDSKLQIHFRQKMFRWNYWNKKLEYCCKDKKIFSRENVLEINKLM